MLEYKVTEREGDRVRLLLRGELAGPLWTDRLRGSLERHFVDDGVCVIRTDLSGLSFMDNFGIAALVALHREAAERGKRFTVEGQRGQVEDKLRVTGVLKILGEGD